MSDRLLVPLAALAVAEIGLRWADLGLPALGYLLLLVPLAWRRSRPVPATIGVYGATTALALAELASGTRPPSPVFALALLLYPHALLRWGTGPGVPVAMAVVLASATLSLVADGASLQAALGGYALVGLALALGALGRSRAQAYERALAQVRAEERANLARDLHDTVAHHVSAMLIRARAGLAVAETRPDAAAEALQHVEAEATRALAEMRSLVGLLRETPQPSDLADLASDEGLRVRVSVEGEPGPHGAALYRAAQEAVTNARRHARNATRVDVSLVCTADQLKLVVRDDGAPAERRPGGLGLVGMAERAALLGGTCEAGPQPGGWQVRVVVPR